MLKRICLLISFSLILITCSSDPLLVDASDIDVEINFERFDNEMFSVNSVSEMKELNGSMHNRGGELYEYYVSEMLRSGSVRDDSIGHYLYYFVTDPIINEVFNDVDSTFGDLGEEQDQIIDLFQHFKYHFPNHTVPKTILFYNSAFNYGVTSTPNNMGIGLEMYLGEQNKIVEKLGFPLYMKSKMDRMYLPVDIAHSWLITNVFEPSSGESFLEEMIYYGKLRYAIEACLPALNDALIMRYTQEEFDFCMASEYNIWLFLVDMDWIYTNDMKVKMRFFNEAPTTVGIEGSPGRVGQFVGWRMVKNYMESNTDVTFEELIFETPDNKILKAYKPQPNE